MTRSHNLPQDLAAALFDLLWPPRCAACHTGTPDGSSPVARVFCPPCLPAVIETPFGVCPRCGLPFAVGRSHLCSECLADDPPFLGLVSPFVYGGALAAAIGRLKYGGAAWLARPLGRLFAELVPTPEKGSVVVPIPLAPSRLRARGYNQTALIAGHLCRNWPTSLETGLLARVTSGPAQASLSRAERLIAPRGAFVARLPRRYKGRSIVLVDDVVTTGATVRAASHALIAAGAQNIRVVCLARSQPRLAPD